MLDGSPCIIAPVWYVADNTARSSCQHYIQPFTPYPSAARGKTMTKKTFVLSAVSDRNFFIPADVIKIGFNAFQEPSMVSNRIWGWIGFCGQTLPQPHHQIFTESRFRIGSSNSNDDHDDIVPSNSNEDKGTNAIWGYKMTKGFLGTIGLVEQLAKRDLNKVVRS